MPDGMDSYMYFYKQTPIQCYLNTVDKISGSPPAVEGKDVLVSVVVLFTMPNLSCLFLWFGTDSIDFVFIFASVTFSADHSLCLYLVEYPFYRPWLRGFSQVTALCTAGYQCWSWLTVIQAAGTHQEEQRSIIKSFLKLWLGFPFLLKTKMYSEILILTLKISWDVAVSRRGKKKKLSESKAEDLASTTGLQELECCIQCIIKLEGETR